MSSSSDLTLRLTNLVGMGMAPIHEGQAVPEYTPGELAFCADAFGPRILQYIRNVSGSTMVKGSLAALLSDAVSDQATSVADITSGTTTSAVTAGLTANNHAGMIAYVLDNADSAGAAPEGECSIVGDNTDTVISMDPSYPYSAALAANDDLELIANWQCVASADGDYATKVTGVVLPTDGIADRHYGWAQVYGNTVANITTAATTVHDNLVADAGVLGDGGTDGVELWCATALAVATADQVAQTVPVKVTLFQAFGTGTP